MTIYIISSQHPKTVVLGVRSIKKACKKSSDETESIVIFSAEINL